MVVFNTAGYYGAMEPRTHPFEEPLVDKEANIEAPIHPIKEIGGSVTEGSRFGSLIQTSQGAIRQGVGTLELATIQGGQEPGGAESYGKEAREAIREQARASGTELVSIHSPTNVGNLSGFHPQQGFVDELRHTGVDEVKKAINFSAETAGGGAVVVHTAEFQRPMSEQKWAQNPDGTYKFLHYEEEPGRANTYLVDDRTGKVIQEVRKSQIIREPVYLTAKDLKDRGTQITGTRQDGSPVRDTDWVTEEGRYINPIEPDDLFKRVPLWNQKETRFHTRKLGWNEIVERTNWYNQQNDTNYSPEEMAYRIQMETQMLQYRGSSLYHGQRYDEYRRSLNALEKSMKYYQKLEENTPPEEMWKLLRQDREVSRYVEGGEFSPVKYKKPTEMLEHAIWDVKKNMLYIHEASSAADAQADTIKDTIDHVKTVEKYALEQSTKSYAELGIMAMQETETNPYAKKDIFIAPENLFPEMGFGSHPEELIELVKKSRDKMVNYLTKEKIADPHGRRDKDGNLYMITNPYYNPRISEEQARKEAEAHIKSTLDTQHLGMWRKHFVSRPNESKAETDRRFNKWYMEQIKKMEKEKIIGHIHLVDSLGGGHHHLPVGQGGLPLVDAVSYLKKKGYDGTIISEAHEENARFGAARQLTETWKAFGSPVYGMSAPVPFGPTSWPEMYHGYFGRTVPPMFIYGTYAPSNDWRLWSEVPME
jgi:hypothetical protein